MECMFEFQDKHGAAYDWSPEEVIYLLSQISNLTASSFVGDAVDENAFNMAASGVRLALMAREAEVDINLLPHVFKALREIAADGARIASSTENNTDASIDYWRRFCFAYSIFNLENKIEPDECEPAPASTAE
ncbi:hypothetical protein [Oryzibacter oryziterrae]|uniref:hypothetical protein n=1 Tax=Oryzibacter oryziterrae TaxID=2766474 RepID=UPI001F2EBA41|nr:hypothetical protein [Oryzibacter oryziterrae]